MKKYYRILEVAYDAPYEEVKQAYRDLVRVWHPDRFAQSERLQKLATQKLMVINEAYSVIRSMHVRQIADDENSKVCDEIIDWSRRTTPGAQQFSNDMPAQRRKKQSHQWHWFNSIVPLLALALLLGVPSNSNTGESKFHEKDAVQKHPANEAFANMLGFQLPPSQQYFSVGSTREQVISVQGPPTIEILKYGESSVIFENNRVKSWSISAPYPLLAKDSMEDSR